MCQKQVQDLKTPKFHSEINWPLGEICVHSYFIVKYNVLLNNFLAVDYSNISPSLILIFCRIKTSLHWHKFFCYVDLNVLYKSTRNHNFNSHKINNELITCFHEFWNYESTIFFTNFSLFCFSTRSSKYSK